MPGANPILWAAWAAFALAVLAVTYRVARAALTAPFPLRSFGAAGTAGTAEQPWLYCEDGAPLDEEVRWFRVRPGQRTVVGGRPRSATVDTSFIYLNAHDVAEDNAVIEFDPQARRYRLTAPAGARLEHNNEPLAPGVAALLTDGDTLTIGALSRFRFTFTGPEEA